MEGGDADMYSYASPEALVSRSFSARLSGIVFQG